MRLLPIGAKQSSSWEDGLWREKPGFPTVDGSWIHPPQLGERVPEFEYEEGNKTSRSEPPPNFEIGCGGDCHVRLRDGEVPDRVCRVFKEGRVWYLEALLPGRIHSRARPLQAGDRLALKDGDEFSLARPPTLLAYRVRISEEDNWYIDAQTLREFPNKYPARFPGRSSVKAAPRAPEELQRLAWETDQMRHRSESDQVRVADWSAFSQYVKRHYYKFGIECVPWATHGRGSPVSPKPPSPPPRPLPGWIAELVAGCPQLPGIDPARELPFASCLRASGINVPSQLELSRPLLDWQERGLPAATTARPGTVAATEVAAGVVVANTHLRQSFREWLEKVDESLFLLQYHDQIASNFASLEQIHENYVSGGVLDPSFFGHAGIKKLGHRRMFEKWFRDFC